MLRFFRFIRKKLVEEQRTRQYVYYAFGEIALVMIGILLALQVNNWNVQMNNQQTTDEYVQLLITDLKADTTMLQILMDESDRKYETAHKLMKLYHEGENVFKDSIDVFLAIQDIGRTNSPSFRNNTYNDLVNTGNIKLLKDRDIIDALMTYYTTDYSDWLEEYIYRLWREYFPYAVDLLPTQFLEDAIWTEDLVKEDLKITDYTSVKTPDPFKSIISEFRSIPEMDFHLKNISRTHLLHIRFLQNFKDRATDALHLLENMEGL